MSPARNFWIVPCILLFSGACFLTGITWGLPSRKADVFLFGDRAPWSGREILALAPAWGEDANRGADVAAHPLEGRDCSIIVNQTDAQRAAIVRRYRLYSDQPDEMITLRALAQMQPSRLRLDPKLYQYGGLWIYPIGAIFRGLAPFLTISSDVAVYLDRPDLFGRFYVVMRLYSAAWGLIGVAVMYRMLLRQTASRIIAGTGAIAFTLLPTVINAAHEAKPHLAGAVLGLIAVDFAMRAVESGRMKWAIAAGAMCGAAAGMVLSEWLIVLVLPVMAVMGQQRLRRCAASVAVAILVYAVTNPYVIAHLLGDRAVLESNLGNSAAMYQSPATINGIFHGLLLLVQGGSTAVLLGVGGTWLMFLRNRQTAWILTAAIAPGLSVFLLHATGKPGEYARFALPADVLLVFMAAMGLSVMNRSIERAMAGAVFCLLLVPFATGYVIAYARETRGTPTRLIAAQRLEQLKNAGLTTLAVDAELAPYCLPPVDLFRWKLVLLPRDAAMPADADARIDPVDAAGRDRGNVVYLNRPAMLQAPISWAAKPFRLELRGDGAAGVPDR